MKLRCIIFDCDGLMFNTEFHAQNTWKKVMNQHQVELPEHFFEWITGAGHLQFLEVMNAYPDIYAHYQEIEQHRLPDLKAVIEEFGNVNQPGLVQLLQYLKTQEYKVCIASSSKTEYVRWIITTIGMNFDFDVIIGGDQVEKGKPNPDIFLKAASLAGIIDPSQCLVLEDSKNGHIAAKAAGMHRLFIQDMIQPDKMMKEELIEFQCASLDKVIPLLEELKNK